MIDEDLSNFINEWFSYGAELKPDETKIDINLEEVYGDELNSDSSSVPAWDDDSSSIDISANYPNEILDNSENTSLEYRDELPSDNASLGDKRTPPESSENSLDFGKKIGMSIPIGFGREMGKMSATELSKRINPWLSKCLGLAKTVGCQNFTTELEALHTRWQLPGFRLAFVGEFNRGKSSLINRLLDCSLLPVGDRPTTATLTSIVAGTEDRMEVRFAKSDWQSRPLVASSWEDLTAIDRKGNEQDVVGQVRLTLNHDWVRNLDVELIDTPGVGDLSGRRTSLAFDLLSQCDAAVFVVSATVSFSLTEATFLQQEVMGRHVTQILVVVSKLDLIPQEEQAIAFETIRKRISKISPEIPVLPLHSIDPIVSEGKVLAAVKTQIESMVAKGERRMWRSRKIAGQITDYLSHLIEAGELAIATAKFNEGELEQALNQTKEKIRRAELNWKELRLNLDQRRLQHTKALQQKVFPAKAELLDILSFELKKTRNPKTWWEVDLPFRLRQELFRLSQKLKGDILKALALDVEWLRLQISNQFSLNFIRLNADSGDTVKIEPELPQMSMTDIQQYRILSRLGGIAPFLFTNLLTPPIAIALSSVAWIVADQLINVKLDEQRRLLHRELEAVLDQTFEEYFRRLAERLRLLYNQLIDEIKREQNTWKSAYETVFESNSDQQDEIHWSSIINQTSALKTEILRVIED